MSKCRCSCNSMCSCVLGCVLACWTPFGSHEYFSFHCLQHVFRGTCGVVTWAFPNTVARLQPAQRYKPHSLLDWNRKTMVPKKTQKCGNMGPRVWTSPCSDKGGGGGYKYKTIQIGSVQNNGCNLQSQGVPVDWGSIHTPTLQTGTRHFTSRNAGGVICSHVVCTIPASQTHSHAISVCTSSCPVSAPTLGESLHCARTARALRATFRLCSPRRAPRHAPWKRP